MRRNSWRVLPILALSAIALLLETGCRGAGELLRFSVAVDRFLHPLAILAGLATGAP
jgi:hypothetical protein